MSVQLAWDFDALGFEPTPGADEWLCIPDRGDIHRVGACGHCEFCGKPMYQKIMPELAHLCTGHAAPTTTFSERKS